MRRRLSREQAESIAPRFDCDVSRSGSTANLHIRPRMFGIYDPPIVLNRAHQISTIYDSVIGYGKEMIDGTNRVYSEHRVSKLEYYADGTLVSSYESTARNYAPWDAS